MELYFKDLISKDASLEKLVDDLTWIVHGAEDLASTLAPQLPPESRAEINSRLDRLKDNCLHLRAVIVARAKKTDLALRASPYCAAGIAALAGFALGLTLGRRRQRTPDEVPE